MTYKVCLWKASWRTLKMCSDDCLQWGRRINKHCCTDIRFPGRNSNPRSPGNEEEWQTSAQDSPMVVNWSGIWNALRSVSLFTFENMEVFELRSITASYLPAVEVLEIPQNGKPICWMKISATYFLVFLHLFWQHLSSVTRRYAAGAARRPVFLRTAVRSRSVMPITPKLIFCTACASSHTVIFCKPELSSTR